MNDLHRVPGALIQIRDDDLVIISAYPGSCVARFNRPCCLLNTAGNLHPETHSSSLPYITS